MSFSLEGETEYLHVYKDTVASILGGIGAPLLTSRPSCKIHSSASHSSIVSHRDFQVPSRSSRTEFRSTAIGTTTPTYEFCTQCPRKRGKGRRTFAVAKACSLDENGRGAREKEAHLPMQSLQELVHSVAAQATSRSANTVQAEMQARGVIDNLRW